ncbi:MAG TPA: hypothetical protein VEK73_12425 [Xanthobacteraceae bacterium]|nr:hypothetical protein [Xanthobacteraceae bacterium]
MLQQDTADTIGLVHRLLAASLAAWHVAGRVERNADRIILTAGEETLVVARGAPPFRWTVTLEHDPEKWTPVFGKRSCSNDESERDDDSEKRHLARRERGLTSIAGLLGAVRRVVDPDHQGSRLRIAPLPLVLPP